MKGGKAHQGLPGFVNFDQPPATELPAVQEHTFVFFEALTAHEITQNAVPLTPAQLCGEQAVAKELTRSAEFPMFVSERLHGTPHQSREEVTPQTRAELLAAIADPKREFGLLTTAPSTLLAPAFRALEIFCQTKSMPLPAIWPAHERGQPLPKGCFIVKASHPTL